MFFRSGNRPGSQGRAASRAARCSGCVRQPDHHGEERPFSRLMIRCTYSFTFCLILFLLETLTYKVTCWWLNFGHVWTNFTFTLGLPASCAASVREWPISSDLLTSRELFLKIRVRELRYRDVSFSILIDLYTIRICSSFFITLRTHSKWCRCNVFFMCF